MFKFSAPIPTLVTASVLIVEVQLATFFITINVRVAGKSQECIKARINKYVRTNEHWRRLGLTYGKTPEDGRNLEESYADNPRRRRCQQGKK